MAVSKAMEKKKATIRAYLMEKGYTEDRWGALRKELANPGQTAYIRRYKFLAHSVRHDLKKKGDKEWIHVSTTPVNKAISLIKAQ